MDEQKIRKIIQEEITNYLTLKQFNISKIQGHEHNGSDVVKIPISSISESIPITGTEGGVFNKTILDTQKVNIEYTSGIPNPKTVYTLPVNIIYGNGVGVASAFNGGEAEPGTMVFFENGLTLSALWIKTINGWYGISPDSTA